MCLLVKVLAVLALLWLDFSVAQYSLYITEEHLQSYFSNTDYAELVQGEFILLLYSYFIYMNMHMYKFQKVCYFFEVSISNHTQNNPGTLWPFVNFSNTVQNI